MTETRGSAADRPVYRSAGVKDTIRALNKKFAETPEAAPAASHRGERSPEEDEQSAMLRSVTAQATRRLEEKNKNHGRFRSAADEEFDRVYNHPHGKR